MNKMLEKVLSQPITDLRTADQKVTLGKWERAKAIHEIYLAINWKSSNYKTFTKFCEQELSEFNTSSLRVWVADYKAISKHYNWDEIITISKEVNYNRIITFVPYLKRRVTVKNFIKQAKVFKLPKNSNKFRMYSLSLNVDEEHAAMFEMMLIPYGYTPNNINRRIGISEAFCRWLDNIYEEAA